MRFAGKSVIVTGGAAGIGAASARLFAAEGARVVIADLDPAGEALAAELCGQGREAAFIRADVADARDAESLVALAVRRYGRLDVLHNNAGVLVIGDVTSPVRGRLGPLHGHQPEEPGLPARGAGDAPKRRRDRQHRLGRRQGGRARLFGLPRIQGRGILLLTQCMALDFAADQIRVNAVCPGPTATAMVLARTNAPDRERARWAKELPAGRIGEPEDTARVVAYLASDEASFVTGAAWVVDGGRLLTGIGQSTVDRP